MAQEQKYLRGKFSKQKLLMLVIILGRVVRKPVNVNPELNVNLSITFSYLQMFFTSNVWCSLRLLHLKTEGQTI